MPRNRVLRTAAHWQEYATKQVDLKTQGAFFAQACMDIYRREPGVSIYMFVYVYIKAKTAKYVMPLITVSTFEQTDAPMEMSRRRFAK